jgi:hypothetical protein
MKVVSKIGNLILYWVVLMINVINSSTIFEKLYLKCPISDISNDLKVIFEEKLEISTKPQLSDFKIDSFLLVSVIITFRHGERTSGKGANLKAFKNIKCPKFQVLTPIGAKRLTILGQILFRRYKDLLDSNSLFITSAKNRCLQSLLNFLQGFRNMDLSHMTRDQLMRLIESDKFFEENNFKLLHDCNGPDQEFLEVAGNNYGKTQEKRMENAPDSSEDQDDLGEKKDSELDNDEGNSSLIFESFEDPLKKFKREIFKNELMKKMTLIKTSNSSKIKKKSKDEETEEPKQEEKPFYLKILQSIIDQILYSKFNVFLTVGKSFFSGSKSLSNQESNYSKLCQNYAMTLNKDMWNFYNGDQQDIKFCFYNNKNLNEKMSQDDSFFLQKGIFVAEKGIS